MVVRLGGPDRDRVQVVNSQRYRIKQGMALQLQHVSNANGIQVRGWARVRYDDGTDSLLTIPEFTTPTEGVAAVLASPSDVATMDGWVVDALVSVPQADDVKRGQIYVKLFFDPFGPVLCSDYCYSDFGPVALGTYNQPGPGGGSGHLRVVTLKTDGVPAAFSFAPGVSNTIRLVHNLYWFYSCSDTVASRVLSLRQRAGTGSLPTGFGVAGADSLWEVPDLTLTADQDGSMFATSNRSGSNDNGAWVENDQSTAPTLFPWLVAEADDSFIRFNTVAFEADDFDTAYALIEDWVVL